MSSSTASFKHGRYSAVPFGDAFFTDDATPGGSFTYNVADGIATSATPPPRPSSTTPPSTTALTGTSGDDILIATNGSETLNGGGGNDILIGNAGSHVMTGGTGNDIFAFLHADRRPRHHHRLQQHHRARPHRGLRRRLRRRAHRRHGRDVDRSKPPTTISSRGIGPLFHFDTANETLYFSADGVPGSEVALAQLQAGVTLHAHDILIV